MAAKALSWATVTFRVFFSLAWGTCVLDSRGADLDGSTASALKLPEASGDRIMLAQISDTGLKDRGVLVGKRAFIWGAHIDAVKDGCYGAYYYPSWRDFDKSHTLEWYQKYKPEWVVYQADKKTPAYGFTYAWGAYVPLDISRADVRDYILKTFLMPAVEEGFPAIAYDNVTSTNSPHGCGVWQDGKWVQKYAGPSRDPVFAAAMLDYIAWIRNELHTRGVALALNAKLDPLQEDLTWKLISLADIWLDEGAFSQDCRHQIVDDAWRVKYELASRKAEHGYYVSMNTLCGSLSEIDAGETSWILANFLLVRGAHTYLAVIGKGESGRLLDYPAVWNPSVGKPLGLSRADGSLYLRPYEKGIAVVNPSSKQAATYHPPAGKWSLLTGGAAPASIELGPRSGVVLLTAE